MRICDITENGRMYVGGHRGFRAEYPENTLISYEAAARLGVDMLEVDIVLSKDGVPMMMHDRILDTVTDGTGTVDSLTVRELKKLDVGIKKSPAFAGTRMSTFEEFLDWLEAYPEMLINVEIKEQTHAYECVESLVQSIEKHGISDRVIFNALDMQVLRCIHDQYHFPIQCVGGERYLKFARNFDPSIHDLAFAIALHRDDVTADTVAKYRAKGALVWAALTNDEESCRKVIDLGVRCCVCDDPRACLSVAKKLHLR